jgi:hypothetical protein
MAMVKNKPADLESGNTVDPTLLTDEIDVAYISFSTTNVKIESPPDLGENVTLMIHGKCTAVGEKENKDGEIRNVRTITVTSAHKPGKRPVEDPNQGSIFTITSTADGTTVEPSDDDDEDEVSG